MTEKNDNYSRQLKYLLVIGSEILKEDGVFIDGIFFSKLREFISFHKEIHPHLSEIIQAQKKEALPNYSIGLQSNLTFVNYQNPTLPIFVLMFAFPIFLLGYYIFKYHYVKKTKSKLRLVLQNLSSIHSIIVNEKTIL